MVWLVIVVAQGVGRVPFEYRAVVSAGSIERAAQVAEDEMEKRFGIGLGLLSRSVQAVRLDLGGELVLMSKVTC
jgi:hypothetical protein